MYNITNLYFIAIVLPEDLADRIRAIQHYISLKFESSKSLRVVPHITLKAPFLLPRSMHDDLLSWFSALQVDVAPFRQELNNFGAFVNEKNPVIYIKPSVTEALYVLQNQIITQFEDVFSSQFLSFTDRHFSPHVTVAYRDLTPGKFEEAWQEFSREKFVDEFSIQEFQLLKHDGSVWNIIESYAIT